MKRLLLLLVCLAVGTGCVTPQDKGEWAEAMRDLRGDNMAMRSGPGAREGPDPGRVGNPATDPPARRGGNGSVDRASSRRPHPLPARRT